MIRARHPLRRWTATIAGVAVASLGLAVHTHSVVPASSPLAIEANADPAAGIHEPGDCLACRAHGRDWLPPAPAGSATLAILAPAIALEAIEAPVARSAASSPPTPPRGPPLPTT